MKKCTKGMGVVANVPPPVMAPMARLGRLFLQVQSCVTDNANRSKKADATIAPYIIDNINIYQKSISK